MKTLKKILGFAVMPALLWLASGCQKQLDLFPLNDLTPDKVYKDAAGYKQVLAKVYGSFATTGNNGPAGNPDIPGGGDEGFSDFVRGMWNAQELPTDEAVVGWGDIGLQDFHNMNWTAENGFIRRLYARSYFQIVLCNEYLRESTDEKLSTRGISGADANDIRASRSEARFLRAFQYWVLMDLFGNVPFVTENDAIGSNLPLQIQRADLFNYVESELRAIEGSLREPRTHEYGRADKGAAWALLARLYLNAKTYTGTERLNDAVTYSKRVIDAGYTLHNNYRQLMLADNDQLRNSEFIFTVNYDGNSTQTYGGTTFLMNASIGAPMIAADYGTNGSWAGLRTTKVLPLLFPDTGFSASTLPDRRAQFFRGGSTLDINSIANFGDGYKVTKYRNIRFDGTPGKNAANSFSDSDFPLFRLAEQYLIYAEATLRGGNGDLGLALEYINRLRDRAEAERVTEINLNFILDERARELYWEGHRRTDLIRFDKFTKNYNWPWKGGVIDGKDVEDYLKLYPIPSNDLLANRNLKQNPGPY